MNMVQIIPAAQRKETSIQKLNSGLGDTLNLASQFMQQHEQKQKEQNIVESLKSQTGLDTTGWDPELRKELLKNHYSSKEKPLNPLDKARKEQIELQNSQIREENDQ